MHDGASTSMAMFCGEVKFLATMEQSMNPPSDDGKTIGLS